MRNRIVTSLAIVALFATPLEAQQPQQAGASPAAAQLAMPEVGAMAPEVVLDGATAAGPTGAPIRLSELRGKTVVLAFFPAARTKGCTVQMETYRDRFAELFNGGENVVVLAVSTDADTTLASWAKEARFPMTFGSDTSLATSRAYGSLRGKYSSRNLFVIAPDGRIAHRMTPFNVLSQDAYLELANAVKATLAAQAPPAGARER